MSKIPSANTFDEHNFWVAKVLEIRAMDSQHVYLRVFWLYWPSELPGGRKPYHGKFELIASSAMEIIDASTVEGKALVEHWPEEDNENPITGLYWRQTFNAQKLTLSVSMT